MADGLFLFFWQKLNLMFTLSSAVCSNFMFMLLLLQSFIMNLLCHHSSIAKKTTVTVLARLGDI